MLNPGAVLQVVFAPEVRIERAARDLAEVGVVAGRDFRVLLPLSAISGAILLVLADLASRVTLASSELPIGAFTAILGVPFFLSLLRRGR